MKQLHVGVLLQKLYRNTWKNGTEDRGTLVNRARKQQKSVHENMFNDCLLGSTQALQKMRGLVYAAAQNGAQHFMEMLFTSSAARIAFDAYKDSSPLPEIIARNRGHEETANYLEDVTTRYIFHVVGLKN